MTTGADVPGGEPASDRTAEAAVHLQRAAIEFIAAARTLLDVAEEAVREPAGVMNVVSETLGALLGALGTVSHHEPGGPTAGGEPGSPRRRPGVEHIKIS
jgi:hypothetical protein